MNLFKLLQHIHFACLMLMIHHVNQVYRISKNRMYYHGTNKRVFVSRRRGKLIKITSRQPLNTRIFNGYTLLRQSILNKSNTTDL